MDTAALYLPYRLDRGGVDAGIEDFYIDTHVRVP
jgi:hypothetical protein